MDRRSAVKKRATPTNTKKQTNQMNRPKKPPPKNAAKNEAMVSSTQPFSLAMALSPQLLYEFAELLIHRSSHAVELIVQQIQAVNDAIQPTFDPCDPMAQRALLVLNRLQSAPDKFL
jgi:hypothetical protein